MESTRAAGVLCHVSSLPGEYGIGTFGKEARRFVRRLAESGVKYWQILPLVQTGFGDSPYSSVCCTSGNPYFIDLETLAGQGLLTKKQLRAARLGRGDVDYGALYRSRYDVLRKAYARFDRNDAAFRAFVESGAAEDYALFMTAKKVFGGACFSAWDRDVRFREKAAMEQLRTEHGDEYEFWQFLQYEFSRQWFALKGYANSLGIKVIGDMPLYVAYDSADVWAHPELFKLDEDLKPVAVAGVPPDYFSETGQLWGNPVYDWEAQKQDGYSWWKRRISEALHTYDLLRIDHFRGFDRYYEIPAGAETAVTGEWRDGPKSELFRSLPAEFPERIVAEDLGTLDDGVYRLLSETGLPGMRVLLFGFDGNGYNPHLPSNVTENCVCYTGTHDNDTVAGYVRSLSEEALACFRSRVAAESERAGIDLPLNATEQFCAAFVKLALASRARLAVLPVQDLLGAGNESRMNTPGAERGNWRFRLRKLPPRAVMRRLKRDLKVFGR